MLGKYTLIRTVQYLLGLATLAAVIAGITAWQWVYTDTETTVMQK